MFRFDLAPYLGRPIFTCAEGHNTLLQLSSW